MRKDAGGEGLEQGEAVGFDSVFCGNPGTLVAEDGVRIVVTGGIPADQLRPIRDEDKHFCVQCLEFGIVMPQLRHMVGAVNSGKAEVEDEEDVAGGRRSESLKTTPSWLGREKSGAGSPKDKRFKLRYL